MYLRANVLRENVFPGKCHRTDFNQYLFHYEESKKS
jgi:hypothetical protein